jgi:hypothetical protein
MKTSGSALEFVPENLRTAELCLEVVNSYNRQIQYIKNAEDHRGGRGMAITNINSEIERVFKEIPEELREEMRSRLESF